LAVPYSKLMKKIKGVKTRCLKENIYVSKYAQDSLVYTLAGTDFSVGTVQENRRLLKRASYARVPRNDKRRQKTDDRIRADDIPLCIMTYT
jgi:hypothetical protein